WRDGLVVSSADQILGVADGGAATVEWHADGTLTDIDLVSGRVLLRTSSDGVEVREIPSGVRRWSTSADRVLQAQFIGTWVGLTDEDGIRVVEPEDGMERLRWHGVAPTARVAHLALDRYTVVAWPAEDGTLLAAYDDVGVEVFSRSIPGAGP